MIFYIKILEKLKFLNLENRHRPVFSYEMLKNLKHYKINFEKMD